ncbi:MAG: DUF3601 domain-containing protein [Cyclobacteriaceae bacterium]|nr:DUF3601 domain-containing protein [Cyclobacteriaceae bacterium]
MVNHINDLIAGQKIRVITEFLDFDNYKIEAGRILTFTSYTYFPYDGGYTFQFEEDTIRLAEIDAANDEVLTNFSKYFELM